MNWWLITVAVVAVIAGLVFLWYKARKSGEEAFENSQMKKILERNILLSEEQKQISDSYAKKKLDTPNNWVDIKRLRSLPGSK